MYKKMNFDENAKYDKSLFKAVKNVESVTSDVSFAQFGDMILNDTPGFDDPNIPNI